MSALARLGFDPSLIETSEKSNEQLQTGSAFGFKWAQRATYESEKFQTVTRDWLLERYCGGNPRVIDEWLAGGGHIILDAGCGSGNAALLFFGDHLRKNDYLGVDISSAVDVARQRFVEAGITADFIRADITSLPIPDGSVDLVFSEGVLHHTDDTERSFQALSRKLKRGGRFLFYVYAKKSVIREFTDDHVREALRDMNDQEAWEALLPLTRLGRALGDLNATIDVPDDIPYLGIPKGRHNLQRLFYWHICKTYYRPEFTEEEMNHVNFDWFRPLNCHRHTPEEVRRWCRNARLTIEHLDTQESGITVVARKSPG